MFTSSKSSLNPLHLTPPPKNCRQELLVEVNIGKKGEAKQIRLCDIHNMNNVEQEVKWFIKNNGLKETAFSYIKEIIVKQISQRKEEMYFESHSKCPQNCRCSNKMHRFQEKQKHIFDAISANDYSRRSVSKSPELPPPPSREPQHIEIKITPKIENISTTARNEEVSSFVFNSSFTLPSSIGEKQRFFMTDELYENILDSSGNKSSTYFSSMSEFKSKEREKQNKISIKSKDITIKRSMDQIVQPLETSFKKNSIIVPNTPIKQKAKLSIDRVDKKPKNCAATPLGLKKSTILSTKQRKAALMTPQKSKANDTLVSNLIHLNSQTLESMVIEHKKTMKQNQDKLTDKQSSSQLFPQNSIPQTLQMILQSLFKKLTNNNPAEMREIHSQYVSYQSLERQQLHFMGVLFEKIDHKELNHLNFTNFRSNSLKYCWKQLEQLLSASKQKNERKPF